MAGMAKAGGIEHVLGDRVGDDRAGAPWRVCATAVAIDSTVARRWPGSGRPGAAETPVASGTTGSAPAKTLRCFLG